MISASSRSSSDASSTGPTGEIAGGGNHEAVHRRTGYDEQVEHVSRSEDRGVRGAEAECAPPASDAANVSSGAPASIKTRATSASP